MASKFGKGTNNQNAFKQEDPIVLEKRRIRRMERAKSQLPVDYGIVPGLGKTPA